MLVKILIKTRKQLLSSFYLLGRSLGHAIFFCILLLLGLSGCRSSLKKSTIKNLSVVTSEFKSKERFFLDIPTPLYDTVLAISPNSLLNISAEGDICTGYRSPLSLSEIVLFYEKEMERLGWRCIKKFQAHESILLFETPLRICVIVCMNTYERYTDIIVCVGNKK